MTLSENEVKEEDRKVWDKRMVSWPLPQYGGPVCRTEL